MTREVQFEFERELVRRLLDALGLSYGELSGPRQTYGRETGADVVARVGSHVVGVQVTVFHGDDGPGGSQSRRQEEQEAARGIYSPSMIPPAGRGLAWRVRAKVATAERYTFKEFDEAWLLIAAALPKPGAIKSTYIIPFLIGVRSLDQVLGEELRHSKYARAFLHVHLPPTIFEWSPATGWSDRDFEGGEPMEPRWLVGCIQNGPKHDVGLRWFVTERVAGELRAIAYTETEEDAERIVAALEQTKG